MSMSFKRFLSLALVFAMMFTMLPMTLAEDEQPVEPVFEEIFEEEPADEEPVEEEPVEEEPVDEEPVDEEPVEEEPVEEEPVDEEPVEEEPVEEEPVEEEPVEEEPVEEEPVEEEPVEEEPVEEEPAEEEPAVEEPVEEEPAVEEPAEEEPAVEEPAVDEEVAKVQAMIDALPTSVSSEAEAKALYEELIAVAEIRESLSDEEIAKLDFSKFDDAVVVFESYYGLNTAAKNSSISSKAETDGWYWGSDNTLFIKDGQTVDLYAALTDDSGINLDPKSYKGTYGFGAYSAEIKYDSKENASWDLSGNSAGTASLAEGEYFAVATNGESALRGRWTTAVSFTVKHYYDITTAVADGSPEGAGIAIDKNRVNNGESINVTVNDVEGYTYTVKDIAGNNVGETYTPTVSTTLTVTYTSAATVGSVVLTISGNGTVKIGDTTYEANTLSLAADTYTVTAIPAEGYYVKSLKVNDAAATAYGSDRSMATSLTIAADREYTVSVEFAQQTVVEGNLEVKWNSVKSEDGDTTVNGKTLKERIIEAVIGEGSVPAASDYSDATVTFESIYVGLSTYKGYVALDERHSAGTLLGTVYGHYFGADFVSEETTENVKISFPGNEVYDAIEYTATITLIDARTEAQPYSLGTPETVILTLNDDVDKAAIQAAVAAAISGTNDGASISYKVEAYAVPEVGSTGVAVVTVTIAEDESYYASSFTVNVTIKSEVYPATIIVTENAADNGEVKVNGNVYAEPINAYGNVTIVVTPAAGYYTEVTVNGEALAGEYKYTDIDSSLLGVDYRNVFTGVLAVENEKEYAVVVTYAQAPALSVNEGAEIEYNFFYEVTEQVAEVKAEIIEKVITGESDIEADQLTVEVYQSTLVGDSYINIAGGLVTPPSFDEETETLRLTLNATDKYPARTAEVTVTLVEIRKETAITAKDVALVIEDAAEFTADAIKAKMIEAGAQVTGAEADVNNIAVAIPAEFAVPEKGQEATVVVTVSLAETGAYLAAESVTANVSVKHIYDNNNNDVDDAEELYTVTFDSNCDEVEDKVYASVQWNETVEIPVFIREAFNFMGWEPALTGTEFTVTAPAQGTEYLFTAQWTEAWVLNFDGNTYDGTVLVNKGETIEEVPADIWDENHDFLGWFAVDAEGTVAEEAFDFTQVIGGNMTFIAKWMNDFNKNDVADEEESIQIVVNKANDADAIEVVGAVEYAEGLYAYDSTLEEASVTVKAIPVMDAGYSVTYVDGVVIGDTAVNGAYADYAFTTESILVQKDMVIEVNFAVAEIIFNENPDYGFVHGYDTANIEMIFAETIENPKATENSTISITYQARPSMTVSIELPEELNNILGIISSLIPNYDGKSISFDLPEAWASVDEEVPEYKDIETVTQEFYDALPDDLSTENIWNSLGGIRSAIDGVTESLTHYGKHEFGYDGAGSKELIRVTYSDERMNLKATDKEITIYDDRTPVTINASDVSVAYNSYTVESLIGLMNVSVVADDGADLGNDVSIKEIIEGKDVGEYEITLRYSGNETYGVANKTVTVTVVKAPSAIDYDSQTVVYGSDYSFNLVKSPSNLKAIEFIIGVDVAALDVSEEGVSGTKPTMWLEIPESVLGIAGLLIPDEGTVVDLNGLRDILDGIANMGDLVGGLLDNETINQLFDGIDSIMGMLNLSDLSIAINTGNKPSNIGIYLAGAVSADSNYETSYTVDYLLIVPNTEKVELEWLVNDDNFIVSLPLASNGEYLKAVVKERAEMNDSVKYLYVGYGADEEIKLYMSDDASIDVSGGYVQIAYILEWNNDIAYAIPLVRPVLVVPGYYNIQFVDEEGNPLTEYVTTFDNTEKAIETLVTDIDGNKVDIVPEVRYYGVQTNGKTYDSDIAPKHAGAYAVVASIIEKDEKDVITAAGLALGAMVIVPAETEVVAENAIVTYTGSDISFSDFYTVNTESTANFDMTVISASLADTGDFSKQGWAAVTGNVNVDFPAWIDRILSEMYPNDYADGVNAKDFADKIDEYAAKLNEIGVTNDVIDAIKAALNEIPDSLTLTFEDDKAVEGIGLFAFIAIVTDSDHIPSYDSGVIAVVPDVNVNYLKFNYEDANGIITEQLLKSYDLNASAYTDSSFSEKDEEATALVKNVFISVDENGFTFETDYTKLTNGAYIQISYIPGEISSDMHFARMIARSLLIVPDALEVTFEDAEGNVKNAFEFGYGEEIAIETVVSYEGTPIDTANGELTVRYIGFDKNGERYDSTDKPTEIGVYAVIATYVEKSEATGDVARIGANAASLVISIGTLEFELIDTVKHYDGEEKFVDMVNPYNADFVYVIVNRETKEVMIGLEEDAQAIYDEIVNALAEIGIELGNEYDVEKAIDAIECVIAKVECFFGCAMNEEQLAKLEELKGLLNAIDGVVSYITINGGKPTEKGVYDVYALSISENFKPVFDSAVLEIKNLEILEIGEVWLSLNLESEVHVNVDFTVNGLLEETQPEDILEKLSLMIWNEGSQPETDAESVMEANPDTILTEVSYDAATGRYRIRTAGIAAKDMADVKYMKLAANNGEDGYNYSIRYKFSPKIYCDHVVTSNYGKELQDLCVALMNYGAAAQEYFHGKNGYQYDVAMNADGFYQDYELEAYDASLIDELAAINESKHGEFVYNGKFTRYDHYLSLEGAIALNFDLHYNGDASEAGLYVWSEKTYANASVLTKENAEKISASDMRYGSFKATYAGNAAKEIGDTVYACAYAVIDGETYYSGIFQDSIEKFAEQISSGSYGSAYKHVAEDLVVYGEYARKYFKY